MRSPPSTCADPYGPYALILTPTRELAVQIHQQASILGTPYKTRQTLVTGGGDLVKQSIEIAGRPHFIGKSTPLSGAPIPG